MNDKQARRYFKVPESCPVVRDWPRTSALLQPGDIGCSVGSPQSAALFRTVYGVPYTHTWMACNPATRIGEALPQGFVEGDAERYKDSAFAVFRWKGITPAQQVLLGNTCLEQAEDTISGKPVPYDYGELAWLIMRGMATLAGNILFLFQPRAAIAARALSWAMGRRNLLDRHGRVICSGKAADISATQGFTLDVKKGFVAPGHFATSGKLDVILVHPKP